MLRSLQSSPPVLDSARLDSLSLSRIGAPTTFARGPFAGRTLRAEVREIQKADLGRKYARKDRRPLDPPPVVLLKLFEVRHPYTMRQHEQELTAEDIDCIGVLCHVDLFTVPDSTDYSSTADTEQMQTSGNPLPPLSPTRSSQTSGVAQLHGYNSMLTPTSLNSQSIASTSTNSASPSSAFRMESQDSHSPNRSATESRASDSIPRLASLPFYADGASRSPHNELVHYFGDTPIYDDSKRTDGLAGSTFAQASQADYEGKKSWMFVFSDLAVKLEGTYILRYRCFDILSQESGSPNTHSVLAECYGGAFKIFSTKDFPGLRASTDLTRQLSQSGMRLNARVTERKRRKSIKDPDSSTATKSDGKRFSSN